MATCARQGCQNDLNSGNKYCSRSCAAKARYETKGATIDFKSLILDKFGSRFEGVVDDIIKVALQEEALGSISIPFPTHAQGREDFKVSFDGKDYRPGDLLDYETIEMMERSGPVMFATWMMMSRIIKVFSDGRYIIESPDQELAEVATSSLNLIMSKMSRDFIYSSFVYGASFQEKRWFHATKYQLGMSNSRSATTAFAVPNVPLSLNPKSISHILHGHDKRSFAGFVQKSDMAGEEDIEIRVPSALVIPYNSKFGNLWGRSFFEAIYPLWVWYELTLRAMARYVDKEAKPISLAKAPSRGMVEMSDGTEVDALDLALILAGSLSHSNAVAIPSDRDKDGNPEWELGHIVSQDRSTLFIGILEYLSNEIVKAALSAENSVSKSSGGVGSYNIGEIHFRSSALVAEIILLDYIYYLNKYFMPDFSLYTRGLGGPPIWMKTQPIDQQERDMLLKLIGIAGNSPLGERFFNLVNWREMAETSNVPTISEEEADQIREDEFKRGLDHQKKQMEMLAKVKQPSQPGQGAESDPSPGNQVENEVISKGILTLTMNDLLRMGNVQIINPADRKVYKVSSSEIPVT